MDRQVTPEMIERGKREKAARKFLKDKQFDQGIAIIEAMAGEYPTGTHSAWLASIYSELGNIDKAREWFQEALRRGPKRIEIYVQYAKFELANNNAEVATSIFDSGIKECGEDSSLVRIKDDYLKRYSNRIAAQEAAVVAQERKAERRKESGQANQNSGHKKEKYKAVLSEGALPIPDQNKLDETVGRLLKSQRVDEAIELLKENFLVLPRSNSAVQLASIYEKRKDVTNTRMWLQKAIEAFSDVPDMYIRAANFEMDQGKHSKAESILIQGLKSCKGSNRIHKIFARQDLVNGQYKDALSIINEAIRVDKKDFEAHLIKGQIFFQQQRYTEAEPCFRVARRLEPKNCASEVYLIKNHILLGQTKVAEKMANVASRLNPEIPDFYIMQAELCKKRGDTLGMNKAISRCMKYCPDSVTPYQFMAKASLKNEDQRGAIRWCEKGLRKFPEDIAIRQLLTRVLLEKGDTLGVTDVMEQMANLKPSVQASADYKRNIGLMYIKHGNYEKGNESLYKYLDDYFDKEILTFVGKLAKNNRGSQEKFNSYLKEAFRQKLVSYDYYAQNLQVPGVFETRPQEFFDKRVLELADLRGVRNQNAGLSFSSIYNGDREWQPVTWQTGHSIGWYSGEHRVNPVATKKELSAVGARDRNVPPERIR